MVEKLTAGHRVILFFTALAAFESCQPGDDRPAVTSPSPAPARPFVRTPSFNEDSAYRFIEEQVAFGPRIPGTPAHAACATYLAGKLKSYGLRVMVQKAITTTYDKRQFELSNIIASHRPELSGRLLLCSHWDTRPFADRDSVRPTAPFDGANDGASSTAALLEIARQLAAANPAIGVDLIFFDLEDYGQPQGASETWGLGSQHWARNPHQPGYFARYGMLLDMVGAPDAVFPREGYSVHYAKTVVDKVWKLALDKGYGKYFAEAQVQAIIDDHYFINTLASIPCINIIHYEAGRQDFMLCHHRHCDRLENIDRHSLKAAGQVALETVYFELNAMQ